KIATRRYQQYSLQSRKTAMTTGRILLALLANRQQFLRLAAGAFSVLFILFVFAQDASSQTSRTIKLIVPVPPGGAVDFLARLLAEQISRSHGPIIVIESRPGAGGRIATEAVARLAPDGTTLLMTYPSLVIDPHVRKVSYQPLTSFEPICNLVEAPNVIVVNSASSYRSLGELMSAARARPGEITMASIGPASN